MSVCARVVVCVVACARGLTRGGGDAWSYACAAILPAAKPLGPGLRRSVFSIEIRTLILPGVWAIPSLSIPGFPTGLDLTSVFPRGLPASPERRGSRRWCGVLRCRGSRTALWCSYAARSAFLGGSQVTRTLETYYVKHERQSVHIIYCFICKVF